MFLIFGLCSGLAALGLLGGAVWAYLKQQRTLQNRIPTNGTVIGLTSRITASGRSNIICPIVEFTVPSGEKVRFTSEFGSLPASHTVGQGVTVRYDPVDPQKAEIESGMSLWLTPLILVFMGAIACCLSALFLGFYGLGLSP